MGGLYQVNWSDLSAASAAAVGLSSFAESMLDDLEHQTQALQQKYTGSASLAFVSDTLLRTKAKVEKLSQAFLTHGQATQAAADIASSTEKKNTSIV